MSDNKKFVIRVIIWALFACVLPILFIGWRYDLFKGDALSLSGWGIIAVIIMGVFIITLIKYVRGILKPGIVKQCVDGVVSILLPLIALLIVVHSLKDSISLFEQALIVVIVCEAIGIPVNPFPDLVARLKKEGKIEEAETMSDILWNKFFTRKKEDK